MTIDELKQLAIDALEDVKAEDILVLDVKGKTTVTDWVIVATGSSSRHVRSIANNVAVEAKKDPLAAGLLPGCGACYSAISSSRCLSNR